MQNEKIAVIVLAVVIIGALSAYLLAVYGEDILGNLFEEEKMIEIGDCADVHFTGRFVSNDTVFETTYENVARDWGLYVEERSYVVEGIFVNPNMDLTRPIGYENYSAGKIVGFLNGLVGIKEGERKNITIPPEEAYGDWNETLIEEYLMSVIGTKYYPRYTEYDTAETIPSYNLYYYGFQGDITNITVNETFTYINGTSQTGENVSWQIQITNVSGENVTIQHIVENGTIIDTGLWHSTIIVDNDTTFRERADPEIGSTFSSGGYLHTKILDVNETSIRMAMNVGAPSLAFIGQTLEYELNVIKIYKTSQAS